MKNRLLLLVAVVVVLDLFSMFDHRAADFSGLFVQPGVKDRSTRVVAVFPGTSASVTGIRIGDYVELLAPELSSRLEWFSPLPGDKFRVAVSRGARHFVTTIAISGTTHGPDFRSYSFDDWANVVSEVLLITIALVIALQRAAMPGASSLVIFCALSALSGGYSGLPVVPRCVASAALVVSFVYSTLALSVFTAYYPRPGLSWFRLAYLKVVPYFASIVIIGILLLYAYELSLPWPQVFYSPITATLAWTLFGIFAMICIISGYWRGSRKEREQIKWTSFTIFGIALCVTVLTLAYRVLNFFVLERPVPFPRHGTIVILSDADLATAAVAVGLAFAVLSRRVLDIKFIVKRSVIFGILSSGLLVLYGVANGIIGAVSQNVQQGRLTAFLLVIFGAGAFLPKVRDLLNAGLDRLIFGDSRKRAERMSDFLSQAEYVHSEPTLAEEAVTKVSDIWKAPKCAFYSTVRNGGSQTLVARRNGEPPSEIRRDSGLILRLLTDRHTCTVEAADGLDGYQVALPFFYAGELIALMIMGWDYDDDSFDGLMEEREAIETFCQRFSLVIRVTQNTAR